MARIFLFFSFCLLYAKTYGQETIYDKIKEKPSLSKVSLIDLRINEMIPGFWKKFKITKNMESGGPIDFVLYISLSNYRSNRTVKLHIFSDLNAST